ncbi:MAG: phosphate ABC transporter substrate-binding protein, partial [Mucinivorans sp.]
MKKLIILALALTTLGSWAQKLKGSDTVLPLAQKEAESYIKKNP